MILCLLRLPTGIFLPVITSMYPQTHSDNTFTNMVCWNHYAHYTYAYVEKNLIIASTIGSVTRFRPPIGPRNPALLRSLIRLASDVSDNQPVVLIDPDTARWMQEVCPGDKPCS